MAARRISIILPSFNDSRVLEAIASVRRFDDLGTVRLIVIDGASEVALVAAIRARLADADLLVSEPDRGIFDALNKGLARCTTEYMGWLGSDDRFSGRVLASDVVAALQEADLFVARVAFFRGESVTRITGALPCRLGLDRIGLHNPHFGTFGRTSLLASGQFRTDLRAADIEYFLDVFRRAGRVRVTRKVSTLQGEGGYSTRSARAILASNKELIDVYGRYAHPVAAPFAVALKLLAKSMSRAIHLALRTRVAVIECRPGLADGPAGSN
jgi:glycosyltransferase involved in cell wall biosynthesis